MTEAQAEEQQLLREIRELLREILASQAAMAELLGGSASDLAILRRRSG